jgi:hypothetical protein
MRIRCLAPLFTGLMCFGLGSCLSVDADGAPWTDYSDPPPTFSIGGTVAGVAGMLTLQNSNGTLLNVAGDGSFAFETAMVPGALYNVTVVVPPAAQSCAVTSGSGTVGHASIRNVSIVCR